MKMWKEPFGTTCKGEAVVRWWLENKNGTKAAVLTYGATLQSLIYQGTDVVLGFDDMEGYEAQDAYVGAVIGRYANRIGAGKFELNGKTYDLFINNGPNHLHGGKEGFDKKIWRVEEQEDGLHSTFSARVLMPPSIFSRVPLIAPSTTEAMRMSTFSPLRLPVMPIYMVQAPRPVIAALLTLSGMPFLNSRPMDEPIITVITFIITPSILPILSPYISVWGA